MTGLGLSIIAPDIPSMPATPAPDPRPELRPWQLAVAGAALYLAWLNWGTRENPPIPYQKYRSGQTFESVRETLKREQDAAYDAGQYMWVTRSTVLGRWRELKLGQYNRYLDAYEQAEEKYGARGKQAGDIF